MASKPALMCSRIYFPGRQKTSFFFGALCLQSLSENWQVLMRVSLQAFQDSALQDVLLGEYPGVDDNWLEVLAMQGSSLLAVDISGSAITDSGLALFEDCSNLQSLNFNCCDHIFDVGLQYLVGLTNLTSLSFRKRKKCNAITATGLCALVGLLNLTSLDLERCSGIHGGLVHLKALTKLESLNIGWCNCIKNSDIKPLTGLMNLKELQISWSKVTGSGLVGEGHYYFHSIGQGYGIIPRMEHNVRMVDLLGWAGHLVETEDFIHKMPLEPNALVW